MSHRPGNPAELFASAALAEIPKILTLLDRNPHSPTYGCFDRLHWHYKVTDFPSGMSQEFVWPLALAHSTRVPGNRFHDCAVMREWVRAGIAFAARRAHADGSCDDYFPFERADGAAAFSLLAAVESCRLLGVREAALEDFFKLRADLLAHRRESGRLTNHQALIALALQRVAEVTGESRWNAAIESRLQEILAWQSSEGWFPEYEGFDPGYHTLTIWCLACLNEARPDPSLRSAIESAVDLAADFVHPDGSYGGEYGCRNTYNFFPAGFELAGAWLPRALSVNDRFLAGIAAGLAPCYADDRIVGHHVWNYLLAFRHFVAERPAVESPASGQHYYREAGMVVDRRDGYELFCALNKGGVFKLFHGGRLAVSDTGWSVLQRGARNANAVTNLMAGDHSIRVEAGRLRVEGVLGYARHKQMTPLSNVALRLFMMTVGRWFPDLVRRILQRLLITGTDKSPFSFSRTIEWVDDRWQVRDSLSGPWDQVEQLALGRDQTANYNVMSRTFQPGQLAAWTDLTARLDQVAAGAPLTEERRF